MSSSSNRKSPLSRQPKFHFLDPVKVALALSKTGCGFYISEKPLVSSSTLSLLQKAMSRIRNDDMSILFNESEAVNISRSIQEEAAKSVGSGPSRKHSVRNCRKYISLSRRIDAIRSQDEIKAYADTRKAADEVMRELGHIFSTGFKRGEWSFIRNVGICNQQMTHCDGSPETVNLDIPDMSMLMTLHDLGCLNLYRGAHLLVRNRERSLAKYEETFERITYNKGFFVIFRQDLPHNGTANIGLAEKMFFGFIWKGMNGKRKHTGSETFVLQFEP